MRVQATLLSLLICAACASAPDFDPRQYLDEQTAATITVVAEPWIYSRERTNATSDERDFLNIYAIDVNRMGDHRQYLAVLQSTPLRDAEGRELHWPTLELQIGDEIVSLQASREAAKELGVASPVAESYTPSSKWWYFPLARQTLARIASVQELQASLLSGAVRARYALWRDGRAEAAALTSALP